MGSDITNRISGYYWVKFCGEWKIAKWWIYYWNLPPHECQFGDGNFEEINENILLEKY